MTHIVRQTDTECIIYIYIYIYKKEIACKTKILQIVRHNDCKKKGNRIIEMVRLAFLERDRQTERQRRDKKEKMYSVKEVEVD